MIFGGWDSLLRIVITCILAYVIVIAELRISGKRTLSKMNSFDFIVTVALGSMLASTILSRDVPLLDGAVGIGLLIGLQYLLTWLSTRSQTFLSIVKGTPSLIYYRGAFLGESMRRERVAQEEVYAAIRSSGFASMEKVQAVVLETDGSFTVVGSTERGRITALQGVRRYEQGHGVDMQPEREA